MLKRVSIFLSIYFCCVSIPMVLHLPDVNVSLPEHYNKIYSYQLLHKLGCPVPKSSLIKNSKHLNDEVCREIVEHLGTDHCSLRFQYTCPILEQRHGGMKTKIDVSNFHKERDPNDVYLLWPVEHIDRVANLYGISILYVQEIQKIFYEIVGQGFDGTDLNKGEISPHQKITLNVPEDRGHYGQVWHQANVSIVSQSEYENSVLIRKEKLKRLGVSFSEDDIPASFSPISLSTLETLDRLSCKLFSHFGFKETVNISATITRDWRVLFWDFQIPRHKTKSYLGHLK